MNHNGLLALAGVVTTDEARAMARLDPLTAEQKKQREQMLLWCTRAGVPLPPSWWGEWEG